MSKDIATAQHLTQYAAQRGISLTISEKETIRRQAEDAMRKRLETRRPEVAQYLTDTDGKAATFIAGTLQWSKVAVPVIALLAALASSVRTVQTASEIYTASGSHPIGVILAAVAFTLSAEGALFTLALAQEGQRMRYRAERRERHLTSLASIGHNILVRIGLRQPARYDQLPERDGLGFVMFIAFIFAVAANAYMGLRPLFLQIGAASLQDFVTGLWSASAELQMTFIVDTAAVLFPPLMALKAGHLTARFAAEFAEQSQSSRTAYERDAVYWRTAYADPLSTQEGQELLEEALENKLLAKAAREYAKARPEDDRVQEVAADSFLVASPASLTSTNGNHRD